MTASAPVWVIIAGGGTAGHVLPGLAISAEIVSRGTPCEAIHWVGSHRGIENRLVPAAGYSLKSLPGRGLQRRLSLRNLAAIAGLIKAFAQSWRLLGRNRPAVVLGLGGYASAACGAAAALRRVPLVITEQNAVAGAANRFLSRFSAATAVAFPNTDLRGAVDTGNPVRSEVLTVDRVSGRAQARARLGVEPNRHLVVVFGGSLGARRINNAVAQAVSRASSTGWRDRSDLHIRHIAGHRDYDDLTKQFADLQASTERSAGVQVGADRSASVQASTERSAGVQVGAERSAGVQASTERSAGVQASAARSADVQRSADAPAGDVVNPTGVVYELLAYEDDMATVYTAADLVVCRAGATTVAELAATGVPSILVPLPGAPGDHQTANALRLKEAGAAEIVVDAELDANRLVSEVDTLLDDTACLKAMSDACLTVAQPNAAQAVVDLLEACANFPRTEIAYDSV